MNFNTGLQTSLKESKYKYKIAHWIQEIARNHLSFKSNTTFNYSLHKNDQLVTEYLKQRESHFNVLLKQFIQLTGFKVIISAGLLLIGGIYFERLIENIMAQQKMCSGYTVGENSHGSDGG